MAQSIGQQSPHQEEKVEVDEKADKEQECHCVSSVESFNNLNRMFPTVSTVAKVLSPWRSLIFTQTMIISEK